MGKVDRIFVVGGSAAWLDAISERFGVAPKSGLPAVPAAGDLVVLDAATAGAAAAMPLGNAFSTCRELKAKARVGVVIVLRVSDPFGAEIARFCMADGVITVSDDGVLTDLERIAERLAARQGRPELGALLDRLEGDVAGDPDRSASALQKILNRSEEAGIVERLTDPETGLFDGPFASFKLDEEFKRAQRFHQPLSLVLLDCGVEAWPEDSAERRVVLAEIAALFLTECRDIDILARFTDRVFLFLLPGTGPDGAAIAARRAVASLRDRKLSGGVRAEAIAGFATAPDAGLRDRRDFLARAEAALELARGGAGVVVGPAGSVGP